MARRVDKWWVRTASDREAVRLGCWFDAAAAERVRLFLRLLRHSKGQWAGQPVELEPWQWERIVGPLFGWRRPDGTRRFRRAYIEVPKKNGKSTLASALALALLMIDGEPGAEVYAAATDRYQAGIVFNESANMAEASAPIAKRLQIVRSVKRIVFPAARAFLQALSSDARRKEGFNIHGLICDELHAWYGRELWQTLQYGGAARRQPLMLAITTAGWDRTTICWEQHEYAAGILSGSVIDPWFLPVIFAAGPDDDWQAPATWRKANPSLGATLREEELAEECLRAQQSALAENAFRRYRLNQWTEQSVRWLPMQDWDAGAVAVDAAALRGRRCYAGLDMSMSVDLTALVLVFPPLGAGDVWQVLPFFWAPEQADRDREKANKQRYDVWAAAGLLRRTPGRTVDYEAIRAAIIGLAREYELVRLGIDRWNTLQLAQQLIGDGLPVEFYGQGFRSMSAPAKELERLVLAREVWHGGHAVLRWCAANASIVMDAAGNIKPAKHLAADKIDGIVALIMALGLALASGERASVYEERGVLGL